MKKINLLASIILISIFIISCGTTKKSFKGRPIQKMSQNEISECGFSIDSTVIFYEGKPIADVMSWEWESFNGRVIQEISLTIRKDSQYSKATELMRYFYTRFPKAKIEINFDGALYGKEENK